MFESKGIIATYLENEQPEHLPAILHIRDEILMFSYIK